MNKALRTVLFALSAISFSWPAPALSQTGANVPSKATAGKTNRGNPEHWSIYSELTAMGNRLSCWVCQGKSAGTALCPGNVLLPVGQWAKSEQAAATACALKNSGRCRSVGNLKCPTQ